MQENNFEKKIQQSMGEFRLRPDDAVWVQVERRIREKKKRRFLFFLLPVAAGLIAVGIYTFQQPNNQPTKSAVSHMSSTADVRVKKDSGINTVDETNTIEDIYTKEESSTQLNATLHNNQNHKTNKASIHSPVLSRKTNARNQTPTTETNNIPQPGNKKNDEAYLPTANIAPSPADAENGVRNDKKEVVTNEDPTIATDAGTDVLHLIINLLDNENRQVKPFNESADSILNKAMPLKVVSTRKWQWGISLSSGISVSTMKTVPGFSENKSADMMNGGAVSSPSNAVYTYPVKATPGFDFKVGLLAQKRLSKKLDILTGLSYHFASDQLEAGYRVDSLIQVQLYLSNNTYRNYYARNNKQYHNQYHFLEWPLLVDWQFNKGKKMPISWQNGFVTGLLVKTNGLLYDSTNNGIYYQDKNLFTKVLINYTTGFSLHFNSKNNFHWSIGPDLQMGLNQFRKPELARNKYLLSGNIHIRLLFPGK